jgi:uncharacterized membrane protein
MERSVGENLFRERRDFTNDAAWACVVYSLVPYLGILFVPVALGFSVALMISADASVKKRARSYFAFAVVIAISQIFLWWLLYFIPTAGI